MLERAEIDIGREIEAILHDAATGVVRVVGLGPLVLFSAPGGNAWILDVEDSLAYCLMRNHRSESSPLKQETERQYALAWSSRFTLTGDGFQTLTDDGRVVAHPDAPAKEIARTVASLRRGARR
jgi:hypothetical protein